MSYAPSSAARRIQCPGSRNLEAKYRPEFKETDGIRAGHAAHWLAEEIYNNKSVSLSDTAPNDEPVTQEMLDAAEVYVADIRAANISGVALTRLEDAVKIPLGKNCRGFVDAWVFDGGILTIWDFKYGHYFVDAFENWQLIYYAAGLTERLAGTGFPIKEINLKIAQPRCYGHKPIRTWTIPRLLLETYIHKARKRELLSEVKNVEYVTGKECHFCAGRHACTALQNAAVIISEISQEDKLVPTPQMLGSELKYLHAGLKLLQARILGLEVEAMSLINRGQNVPYYTLENGRGSTVWTQDINATIALGEMMGVDLKKAPAVITPKQAQKAGLSAELVAECSTHQEGAKKLTPVNFSKMENIFKGASS